MIVIKNKRCSREKILQEYPDAVIIDVTSKGGPGWEELSPFYPHGGIPVPFMPGVTSMSVEGIWQGLKMFETGGIDRESFRNDTMKNIKRTVRKNGRCLGHFGGEDKLLGYLEARQNIYVPSYFWMLENKCQKRINAIRNVMKSRTVVLLDYDTNEDIENLSKPLSHASLIKKYIETHTSE